MNQRSSKVLTISRRAAFRELRIFSRMALPNPHGVRPSGWSGGIFEGEARRYRGLPQTCQNPNMKLGGGFKHFLFSPLHGEMNVPGICWNFLGMSDELAYICKDCCINLQDLQIMLFAGADVRINVSSHLFRNLYRSIFPFWDHCCTCVCSEAIGDGDVDGYQRLPWLLR